MDKEKLKIGLDKAYKEAGPNAYFGNGFHAGVEFAEEDKFVDMVKTVDIIADFGAWLVDNHEIEFNGGEDQIAKLCSDFLQQDTKNKLTK